MEFKRLVEIVIVVTDLVCLELEQICRLILDSAVPTTELLVKEFFLAVYIALEVHLGGKCCVRVFQIFVH